MIRPFLGLNVFKTIKDLEHKVSAYGPHWNRTLISPYYADVAESTVVMKPIRWEFRSLQPLDMRAYGFSFVNFFNLWYSQSNPS